jgi:hypothetical protein
MFRASSLRSLTHEDARRIGSSTHDHRQSPHEARTMFHSPSTAASGSAAGDVRVSAGRVERRMATTSSSFASLSSSSSLAATAQRGPLDVLLAPRLTAPDPRAGARTPLSLHSPTGWEERVQHLSNFPTPPRAQPTRFAGVRDLAKVPSRPSTTWSAHTASAFPGPRGWDRPATPGSNFGVRAAIPANRTQVIPTRIPS